MSVRLIVMAAAVLATAVPAWAQLAQPTLRPGRPARALFGGGTAETGQQLVFAASLGGGYDKDLGGTAISAPDTPPIVFPVFTGSYGMGSARLGYTISRSKISGSASVNTSAHYKPKQAGDLLRSYGASAQVGAQLTSSTALSASHAIARQPYNMQLLYGEFFDPETTLLDLSGATGRQNHLSSSSSVGISQTVTKRIAMSGGYLYHTYNGFAGDPARTSRTKSASASVSYAIFKGAHVQAGYGYTSSRFGTNAPVEYKGLSLAGGLNFDRPISLSRRSTLQFGVGLSGARSEQGSNHYFATGNADFRYELGRSWTAAAHYRRGLDFNLGLAQPVVLDTASAGISGNIGRRIQVNGGGGYSRGNFALTGGAGGFTAASGSASVRTALMRSLGLSVQYAYRQYHFDNPGVLSPGLRPETKRHSVRATLDVWVPLFTRARRTNASR